ncbi:MAG: carotenoid 1,2-hydratase, partial [Nitrospinaceae bacterium]|nr:lipocalin family protein [Nitrospinaceae bacterium]NIR55904.1 lipocalin family protein [Nitrospinaceae bacterium]NIS86350.1 lipocalin family protein [Nitrospinaceae bacterium]NIT83186.1 lipocalin family protein [Nitrospinaceae bacterium]NIU43941.1 lipocalin family protein [Nitrospinaceae bacterium]
WDWFSLKLDNQRELMLYQLRQKDGGIDPFSSGSLVRPDGSHRHLEKKRFTIEATGRWTSEHTGIEYPSGWIVALPEQGVRLTVTPELLDQELHHLRSIDGSYWEGSVSIEGTWKGKPVQGRGYVELVGYGQPLKQELPE